jgi:hypothetical protein
MTKRFFESDLLNEEWFLELPAEYQNLWLQLNLRCNKGGIVELNSKILSLWSNFQVDIAWVKKLFKEHIKDLGKKIFINQFFANQNTYNLRLSCDAVRGGLKTYFEHKELTEEYLRKLGYRFFAGPKENIFEIKNIKEYLFQYPRSIQNIDSVDEKYLLPKNETIDVNNSFSEPMGRPIGTPRNSSSNSRSNSRSNKSNKDINKKIPLKYEHYTQQVDNYENVKATKKTINS